MPSAWSACLPFPPEVIDAIAELVLERVRAELAPTQPVPPLLSVDEAAELIRAKRLRIYDLLSSGRLTRHKDGSRVLVSREELIQLIAPSLPTVS